MHWSVSMFFDPPSQFDLSQPSNVNGCLKWLFNAVYDPVEDMLSRYDRKRVMLRGRSLVPLESPVKLAKVANDDLAARTDLTRLASFSMTTTCHISLRKPCKSVECLNIVLPTRRSSILGTAEVSWVHLQCLPTLWENYR